MSLWRKKGQRVCGMKTTFLVLFPAVREGESNAVGASETPPSPHSTHRTTKVACAGEVMEEPFNTQLLGCLCP